MICLHFYQVNNLFLHQSYLKSPTPSQTSLIKNANNHFLLVKKLKIPKVQELNSVWWVNLSAGSSGGGLYTATALSGAVEIPAYVLTNFLLTYLGR